jgi:cyclic beta-1,2-glucan synthetase
MASLERHLVRTDAGLIRLLDPPFNRSTLEPGYIKGYVPGVRENGGQYTHAAIWAVMAFARMGQRERAWELARMILPASHTGDPAAVERYKVEPYVVVADVYSVEPHVGRGGWSWYTGSAGWMYRLLVESLLGIGLRNGKLRFEPNVPAAWTGYQLDYRYGNTTYRIELRPAAEGEEASVQLDGHAVEGGEIERVDDGQAHAVQVVYINP